MPRILQHAATATAIAVAALIIALVALFSPRAESAPADGDDAVSVGVPRRMWVDYVYLNPHTGFRELKHSWVVRRDGLIFGSRWYELQRPSIVEFVQESPGGTYAHGLARPPPAGRITESQAGRNRP